MFGRKKRNSTDAAVTAAEENGAPRARRRASRIRT